ncbi:MAG TPA: hypothetical protein VJN43_07175 [Bryobacteraceae bacterium]|nr:hypothetical protein [Bryobacteraceae bacterium]
MSEQEEHAAIGRLVAEYTEIKRKQEIVRADLYSMGCALYTVGERLKSYAFDDAFTQLDLWHKSAKPDLANLIARMREFRSLSEQVRGYSEQLQALGIKL